MSELKRTLGRIGFYYLLFIINSVLLVNVIPDTFPTRNLTTIFLLFLTFCLIIYYSHRVTSKRGLSLLIKSISWMALLLILFRGIKYSAFANVDILARYSWYFYYIPILLIPLFFFYIALLVSRKEGEKIPKPYFWMLVLTLVFIALILTNDLHQQIFKFQDGFVNWNSDYSHGWLFYVITVWQYSLFVAAIIILVIKCRVSDAKKNVWIILVPALIGALMYILLLIDKVPKINGTSIFEFPETHVFTVAIIIECCMQLGLVPTNSDYGKIFKNLSISAQITDERGNPVYISSSVAPLTKEQFLFPNGERIDDHTILYKMKLPGGYGFYQDDVTELDRINEELVEATEGLEQETELIRLRNELEEQQSKIKQRNILYDKIAKCTQNQSQKISELASIGKSTKDSKKKDECRKKIVLLGSYIKRYANLMLLSQENNQIKLGELKLSISEFLHYLNYYGIPGEFVGDPKESISSDAVLALFETFELAIENNIDSLEGVFVNLYIDKDVRLKLVLENMNYQLPKGTIDNLLEVGISTDIQLEDEVTYIYFKVQKGEKA